MSWADLAALFRVVACVIVSAGVRRSQLVDAAGGTGAFVKQPLQSVPLFRAEPNGHVAAVIVTLGQLSWRGATQSDGHRSPIVSFHTRECFVSLWHHHYRHFTPPPQRLLWQLESWTHPLSMIKPFQLYWWGLDDGSPPYVPSPLPRAVLIDNSHYWSIVITAGPSEALSGMEWLLLKAKHRSERALK